MSPPRFIPQGQLASIGRSVEGAIEEVSQLRADVLHGPYGEGPSGNDALALIEGARARLDESIETLQRLRQYVIPSEGPRPREAD